MSNDNCQVLPKIKAEKVLEVVTDANDSSGTGYYRTYIGDDIVVKVYENKKWFDEDIEKHEDLDDLDLLPKMITNFCYEDKFYLVLEKIIPACGIKDSDRYDILDNLRKDGSISTLDKAYEKAGYSLMDVNAFNFGYRKDGTFMCLDEGCL